MHTQKHQAWVVIFGGLLCLQLVGCATNVGKTVKVSDEQLAKFGTLSAADALAALETRVNEAMKANMPFFAPNYYRSASEILSDTRKSAEKKPKDEVIGNIAKADAILDKGQTMMAIVQSRLVNELALKDQLDKDNVGKVFPKEYENSIGKLSNLIEKIELEKTDNLDKDKIELIKTMQALDVRTIQYTALHESEVLNEDTRSKDGEEQAPATLAEALRIYLDAGNRIAQAPHDEALVQRAGADTLFAARHARYVNERVLILQNKFKEAVEPIVLEEEKRLLDISTALGHKDLRDQSIENQAGEIAQVAGEVLQGQHKSKQEIGAVNNQSKAFETRLKEANDTIRQVNTKLAEKDTLLAEKDAQLDNKNTQVSEKDAQLTDKNSQLAEKDAQLAGKDAQLKTLNDQLTQLAEQNKSLLEAKFPKLNFKIKASK